MGNFRGLVSCRNSTASTFQDGSGGRFNMSIPRAYLKLSRIGVDVSALFTTSAFGQSPATGPNSTDKPIVALRDLGGKRGQ